jgi:hypothetical protein
MTRQTSMAENAKRPRQYGPNGRLTDRAKSQKPPADRPVTTDLGLGKPLTEPLAPTIWTFRIVHKTAGQKRAGRSTCQTYLDANDAAGDILAEYFEQAAIPPEAMKLYQCFTVRYGCSDVLETADSHGGADGRDWR